MLILKTRCDDPITCLYNSSSRILIGTAGGMVCFFFQESNSSWRYITLTKRSEEAISGLHIVDDKVIALAGDMCVKIWDLTNLEYTTPLVAGCKYERIQIEMDIHTVSSCLWTASFLMQGNTLESSKIVIMRPNGECIVLDLSTSKQSIKENVGPLPERDCHIEPCAFDGEQLLFLSERKHEKSTFSIWNVQGTPRVALLGFPVNMKGYRFGGFQFIKSDTILTVRNGYLTLWTTRTGKIASIRNAPKRILVFNHLYIRNDGGNPILFIVSICRQGFIYFGSVQDVDRLFEYRPHKKLRKQIHFPKYFMKLPYFVSVTKSESGVQVCYNDDGGVYVEENLFRF